MNTPAYPRLSPNEVSLLDQRALALVDDGDVEQGWVLRGIIDKCEEDRRPYDTSENDGLYRLEYDEGYTATVEQVTEILEHLDAMDIYEARQDLGHLADRADEARDLREEAENDHAEGQQDGRYAEGGWA